LIGLDWLSLRRAALAVGQSRRHGRAVRRPAGVVDLSGVERHARTVRVAQNPISNFEIEAWSRMQREPVRGFELDMLRALAGAYLEAARGPDPAAPKMSARPFSLFDAWFGT